MAINSLTICVQLNNSISKKEKYITRRTKLQVTINEKGKAYAVIWPSFFHFQPIIFCLACFPARELCTPLTR